MSGLHPHWHAAEEEMEIPVHTSEETVSAAARPGFASRRPAAIVGILMVLGIGASMFSLKSLPGQITPRVTIHITETGFDPKLAEASPGAEIEWINDDQIPHIIKSDDFCFEGACLETSVIYPDENYLFAMPLDMEKKSYDYYSESRGTSTGGILIGDPIPLDPSDEDFLNTDFLSQTELDIDTTIEDLPPLEEDVIPEVDPVVEEVIVPVAAEPDNTETATGVLTMTPEETTVIEEVPEEVIEEVVVPEVEEQDSVAVEVPLPELPAAPLAASGIPRNPYSIASGRSHPFDASGAPVGGSDDGFHGGAPHPLTQPETGARTIGLTIVASIALLFWITRKSFLRQ